MFCSLMLGGNCGLHATAQQFLIKHFGVTLCDFIFNEYFYIWFQTNFLMAEKGILNIISDDTVINKIYEIRGLKVMLDSDLPELYDV